MDKKRIIRMLTLLALAIALAFGIEAVQIATQPKAYEAMPKVIQEAGEIDLEHCIAENAEYKNGALTIGNEGGSLTADFREGQDIPFLQIWAKKHLKKDVTLQIYYAGADEEFSEERSVTLTADAASMAWEPAIPSGRYHRLKITADGKISIAQVKYSDAVEERVPIIEGLRLWRVPLVAAIVFCILLFLVHARVKYRLIEMLHHIAAGLSENKKQTVIHIILFLVAGVSGYYLSRILWVGSINSDMNWPRELFCSIVGFVLACLVTFRRTLARKPEVLFLIISLCAGSLMVFLYPDMPVVSWDDGYHYDQALTWSYLGDKRLTLQDLLNIKEEELSEEINFFELGEAREALHAEQQRRYENGVSYIQPTPLESKNAYELFAGTGLFVGRALGLTYYWNYCLGKLFNLLAYTICGFFAIRRLKSGKMILSLVLLIPTSLFLASAYAYDPGLTAFSALGLAYCFAEWQESDCRMTREHALIMVGSLLIGCLTKAIYFPLLFIPMFLPKSKFKKSGEPVRAREISRKAFLLLCAGAVMILLATFMIPTLVGEVSGDYRGGDDIDAYGQISGILQNPFRYAGVLLSFLTTFLAPQNAPGLLTFFAYMGVGSWGMQYLWALGIVALTDKEKVDRPLAQNVWSRIFTMFVGLGTLVLVSTSMYIMFTDVGLDTINGVQYRYLLPLIFPTLMVLGSEMISRPLKLEIPGRRVVYNGLIFAFAAFVLFNGIWETCISLFA